jgi:uncharacterized MnhB-related membrane protein
MCEEACPKSAIYLTDRLVDVETNRGSFIYGKDKLVEKINERIDITDKTIRETKKCGKIMDQFLFFLVAFLAVASAVYFVFAKNPLYAILSLIVTMFSIAGMYILLNAQFLAIIQIIVYAGAIMVFSFTS